MPWNTETYPTDLERIRRAGNIPAEKSYLDIIRISMDRLEKETPETVETVRELLDEFENVKSDTKKVRRSANYSLIQADSLRWSEGQRSTGFEVDQHELKTEIFKTLHIELPGWANNGATLGRS